MDIRPSSQIVGIAGTARAQTHGTDSDRGPDAGGVAANKTFADNGPLNEGSQTEDRDADGRRLLDYHSSKRKEDDDVRNGSRSHRSPSLDKQGQQLDFDA